MIIKSSTSRMAFEPYVGCDMGSVAGDSPSSISARSCCCCRTLDKSFCWPSSLRPCAACPRWSVAARGCSRGCRWGEGPGGPSYRPSGDRSKSREMLVRLRQGSVGRKIVRTEDCAR